MNVKSGVKTSEFWVTMIVNVVAAVVAILSARGLLSSEEGELWVALALAIAAAVAPMVMAYTTKQYVASRTEVKASGFQALGRLRQDPFGD